MLSLGLLPRRKAAAAVNATAAAAPSLPGPVQMTNSTPMVAPVARQADAGVAGGMIGGTRQAGTVAGPLSKPPSLPKAPGLKAPKKIGALVDTRGPQPSLTTTVGNALGTDPRANMGGVSGAMHALTPVHTGLALVGLGGAVAGVGSEVYRYVQERRAREAIPKVSMVLPLVGLNVQPSDFTPRGVKNNVGNLMSGMGDQAARLLMHEQVEKPDLTPFMLRDQNPRTP